MANQQSGQDTALLTLLRHDPNAGLRQSMQCYAPIAKAILIKLLPGRPEDVEECLADTFVSLWRHADKLLQSGVPVKAWLIVTARNKGINRYHRLRRSSALPLDEDTAQAMQEFEALPGDAETLVAALVAAMTQPDREIFLRKYYLLQPARQIAAALGLSEANINTRLSRGRERLRRQLALKGVHAHV